MQRIFVISTAILTIALTSTISGCASVKISGGDFQKGVKSASSEIADSYSKLNSIQSDANQEGYAADRCIETCSAVVAKDLNVAIFPPESIKIRLKVIRVLNAYAASIAALSGSDAPADAAAQLQATGEQAKALAEKIQTADKSLNVAKYAEPLSSLAGMILNQQLEKKRTKALVTAITAADPAIKKLLELIKSDLDIIKLANSTAYDQTTTELVVYYNANSKKMSYAERTLLLSRIREISALRAVISSLNPDEMVKGIAGAQNALYSYVTSKRTAEDRQKLNTYLKNFGE